MATKTVVCPTCEAPVEPGRFACPACGSLLVAVAATRRPMAVTADPAPPAPAKVEAEDAADDWLDRAGIDAIDEDAALAFATPEAQPEAQPEPDATEPAGPADDGPSWPGDPGLPVWAGGSAVAPDAAPEEPAAPSRPAWPPLPVDPEGDRLATVAASFDARPPAGAYLPPSAVLPPGEELPLPSSRPAASPTAGLAAARAFEPPADLPTRLIAAGAGIAGIGFLLPWSETIVGSGAFGGYTASWGLAGPGHLLVVVGLFGVWGLAMLADRLGGRVRPGILAVAVGALLLGLVWPYVFGLLGAQLGSWVVIAGAVVLIAGGALELHASRHPADRSSVHVGPGSEPGP